MSIQTDLYGHGDNPIAKAHKKHSALKHDSLGYRRSDWKWICRRGSLSDKPSFVLWCSYVSKKKSGKLFFQKGKMRNLGDLRRLMDESLDFKVVNTSSIPRHGVVRPGIMHNSGRKAWRILQSGLNVWFMTPILCNWGQYSAAYDPTTYNVWGSMQAMLWMTEYPPDRVRTSTVERYIDSLATVQLSRGYEERNPWYYMLLIMHLQLGKTFYKKEVFDFQYLIQNLKADGEQPLCQDKADFECILRLYRFSLKIDDRCNSEDLRGSIHLIVQI